jgi:hypothetical protein
LVCYPSVVQLSVQSSGVLSLIICARPGPWCCPLARPPWCSSARPFTAASNSPVRIPLFLFVVNVYIFILLHNIPLQQFIFTNLSFSIIFINVFFERKKFHLPLKIERKEKGING